MPAYIKQDLTDARQYCGRILHENFSPELKMHMARYISSFDSFDKDNTLGLSYIAAWRVGEEAMWYEYVSKRFLSIFGCEDHELAEAFKNRILTRRVYKYSDDDPKIEQEILTKDELIRIKEDLRDEAIKTGNIEAIYKILKEDGGVIWLKDQARVVFHEQDLVCLSYGNLTDVSKEMKVESKLKQTQMALEKSQIELELRVQKRTTKLAKLNFELKREIEDRKNAESGRKRALGYLRKAIRGTIQAIAFTVETKDAYTAGHQQRVANLAAAIAKEMRLSNETVDGIRMAGFIHDLGKIAVPAEILSKPIPLNDAEFAIIKTHPQVGYEILKDIEFPWSVAQIVFQHHERINGTGYPMGLNDGDILLEAKVISVADAVEAMASHRPYRPALGIDRALDEISNNRGVLYDPEVSDACLDLFRKKGVGLGALKESPTMH